FAREHVDELIDEFRAERDDHGLRCWLLELIGEARSPVALPIFVAGLNGPDDALRDRARRGLELLGTSRLARLSGVRPVKERVAKRNGATGGQVAYAAAEQDAKIAKGYGRQ